jgi:Helix-loop-helix DNA-binding domain
MGVKPETGAASQQQQILVATGNTAVVANFATGFDSEADIQLPDVEKLRQLLPEGEGDQLSQLDIILQAISYIRSLQNNLHMVAEDS